MTSINHAGIPPIPKDFGYHGSFYDFFRGGTVNEVDFLCHINEMTLNDFRIAEKINHGGSSYIPTGSLLLSDVYLAYIGIPFKNISYVDRKGMYGVEHPLCDICRQNTQNGWSMASKNDMNYLYIYYYIPLFDMILCRDCFNRLYEYPSFLPLYRSTADIADMINEGLFPNHDARCVFYNKKPWDVRLVERTNIIRRFGRYNKDAGKIIDSFYKYIESNEKV